MAKRKSNPPIPQRRSGPTTQFSSDRYRSFEPWQRIVFWCGTLFLIHPGYWLIRLILYLVMVSEPLRKRLDTYATQTFVFGCIAAALIAIATVVMTVATTLFLIHAVIS